MSGVGNPHSFMLSLNPHAPGASPIATSTSGSVTSGRETVDFELNDPIPVARDAWVCCFASPFDHGATWLTCSLELEAGCELFLVRRQPKPALDLRYPAPSDRQSNLRSREVFGLTHRRRKNLIGTPHTPYRRSTANSILLSILAATTAVVPEPRNGSSTRSLEWLVKDTQCSTSLVGNVAK